MTEETRRLTITDELVVRYSRRGNFHTERDDPAAIALGGLVAQGTQVCGPAYGMLLDAWGAEFLDHGEVELRFVGMVRGGDTVDATVDIEPSDGGEATIAVRNVSTDIVAAIGTARCRGRASAIDPNAT
jgi:acyl dehydratase